MDLSEVRVKINDIDNQLIELINARVNCSSEVALSKLKTKDEVYKPEREKVIVDKFQNTSDYTGKNVAKCVIRNSRKYQYKMFIDANEQSEAFEKSLTEEQKKALVEGGRMSLTYIADETGKEGLTVSEILGVVSEMEIKIDELSVSNNTVFVSFEIDGENREEAYVIMYMLYMETMGRNL